MIRRDVEQRQFRVGDARYSFGEARKFVLSGFGGSFFLMALAGILVYRSIIRIGRWQDF